MSAVHVVNERGVPEASAAVLERLAALDPALGLQAFRFGDHGMQWAVSFAWPENDRRWERVQTGEIPRDKAFDIIAFLPMDISPDQIPGYVEHGLVAMQSGGDYGYIDAMLTRCRTQNRKAQDAPWDKVIDRTMEMMETHASLVSPDVIRIPSAGVPDAAPNEALAAPADTANNTPAPSPEPKKRARRVKDQGAS